MKTLLKFVVLIMLLIVFMVYVGKYVWPPLLLMFIIASLLSITVSGVSLIVSSVMIFLTILSILFGESMWLGINITLFVIALPTLLIISAHHIYNLKKKVVSVVQPKSIISQPMEKEMRPIRPVVKSPIIPSSLVSSIRKPAPLLSLYGKCSAIENKYVFVRSVDTTPTNNLSDGAHIVLRPIPAGIVKLTLKKKDSERYRLIVEKHSTDLQIRSLTVENVLNFLESIRRRPPRECIRYAYYCYFSPAIVVRSLIKRALIQDVAEASCWKILLDDDRLHPAILKKIATHQFVKYKYGESIIPENIILPIYGKAFHAAVGELVSSRSLEKAMHKFTEVMNKNLIGDREKMLESGTIPSFSEISRNALNGLKAFMKTDIYEHPDNYARSVRVIILDDRAAVFAQPDFQSVSGDIIFDVKTYNIMKLSKSVWEKLETQMRVFQLAYPDAKAVVLSIPYGEELTEPIVKEFEPLSPKQAFGYLKELKKACEEIGEEVRVNMSRFEAVRYVLGDGWYDFEVFKWPLFTPFTGKH